MPYNIPREAFSTAPTIDEFVKDAPKELTCGSVFHVRAWADYLNNSARAEFVADEGYGDKWHVLIPNVKNLKELAEKLRLAFFEMNCDLSWGGSAYYTTGLIDCEVANQRNPKTRADFKIKAWSTNQLEWAV